MKKLTYEQWVSSFVENLKEHFNLQSWTFRLVFSDKEDSDDAYARTGFNSAYLYATVTFYKPAKTDFETGEFDRLIMATVHELAHVFLDPFHDFSTPYLSKIMSPVFMETLEQQTQKLTMVFLKTIPKNSIPPRPNGKHNRTPENDKP